MLNFKVRLYKEIFEMLLFMFIVIKVEWVAVWENSVEIPLFECFFYL